jgi:hypothetical protein
LKTNSLETTDIFRGAFFLCKGGELSGIRFRSNGKRIASFLFTGEGLDQLDKDYMNGTALVNPVQFRESLNRLRVILFVNLRKDSPASSRLGRDYAAASGGTRYDRKRNDRIHQKQR